MTSTRTILFVATGQDYVDEAAMNAKASRIHSGGASITLVTNLVEYAISLGVFDSVLPHPDPSFSYRDKILPLLNLPSKYTLFLDSDAFLTSPVDIIFNTLGSSLFAAAHAPVRLPDGWRDESVPLAFPEFNSGVMLFRRSRLQRLLVRRWLKLYDELADQYQQQWDQASLRSVVWDLMHSFGMRCTVLPPEANLRTTKPWVVGKGMPVFVVHGRVPDQERLEFEKYLNGNIDHFRDWRSWLARYPDSAICPQISPDPQFL